MKQLDKRLGRYCEKRGIIYSRYADDLTFSSKEFIDPRYLKAICWIISQEGWKISKEKTHLTSQRYVTITGLLYDTHTQRIHLSKRLRIRKRRAKRRKETHRVKGYQALHLMIAQKQKKFNKNFIKNEYCKRLAQILGVVVLATEQKPEGDTLHSWLDVLTACRLFFFLSLFEKTQNLNKISKDRS